MNTLSPCLDIEPPEQVERNTRVDRKIRITERRIQQYTMELPEGVRLFTEIIGGYDPMGDPTYPLRHARDVHVRLVRAITRAHGVIFEDAHKVSKVVHFEAWKRSSVLRDDEFGMYFRHVRDLMKTHEEGEQPEVPP